MYQNNAKNRICTNRMLKTEYVPIEWQKNRICSNRMSVTDQNM